MLEGNGGESDGWDLHEIFMFESIFLRSKQKGMGRDQERGYMKREGNWKILIFRGFGEEGRELKYFK